MALHVAWQLSVWGDFPVVTAAILASMRMPVSIDRGLALSDLVQAPARTAMPEMIRETRVAPLANLPTATAARLGDHYRS